MISETHSGELGEASELSFSFCVDIEGGDAGVGAGMFTELRSTGQSLSKISDSPKVDEKIEKNMSPTKHDLLDQFKPPIRGGNLSYQFVWST